MIYSPEKNCRIVRSTKKIPAASPKRRPTTRKSGSVSNLWSTHLPEKIPMRRVPTSCERMADISAIA